jgi:hypothetical protein
MKPARRRAAPGRSDRGASTRQRAHTLADALLHIADDGRGGAPTALDAEMVEHLWNAWMVTRGKQARGYLMRLVLLQKRALRDARAARELSQRLSQGELRAHMPGLPAGRAAEETVRREVARLAQLEPRGRGRPRKGEPKARFYAEVLRALPRLGIERVTERQLIRDYRAAVARD